MVVCVIGIRNFMGCLAATRNFKVATQIATSKLLQLSKVATFAVLFGNLAKSWPEVGRNF